MGYSIFYPYRGVEGKFHGGPARGIFQGVGDWNFFS